MNKSAANVICEYAPCPGRSRARRHLRRPSRLDRRRREVARPGSRERQHRAHIAVPCHAGTAFDGKHLFQIAEDRIHKIDPDTGRVLTRFPRPAAAPTPASRGPRARCGSVNTANARSIRSTRHSGQDPAHDQFQSLRHGVTWVDGELWHGTWEGEESEVRRIDPTTGEVLEQIAMPEGRRVSGWNPTEASDFFAGRKSGKLRAVKRPVRKAADPASNGLYSRSIPLPIHSRSCATAIGVAVPRDSQIIARSGHRFGIGRPPSQVRVAHGDFSSWPGDHAAER